MADLESLYQLRLEIGKRRQSTYQYTLETFDKALQALGLSTPYDDTLKDRIFFDSFNSFKCFNKGSNGNLTELNDCKYLYRLTTFHKVARTVSDMWRYKKKYDPEKLKEKDFNTKFLTEKIKGLNQWKKFRNLIKDGEDFLRTPRNFSFWTNYPIHEGNVLENTFKIGYASDWFDDCAIILRTKADSLRKSKGIRVPTVIDAFDQPIFHTTEETPAPSYGTAIDIKPKVLNFGFQEFVVADIEIDNTDFFPICIKDKDKNGVNFRNKKKKPSLKLMKKLESYYQTL